MGASAVAHGRGRGWLGQWPEDAAEMARLAQAYWPCWGRGGVGWTGLKADPVAMGEQYFYVFQPRVSCV